VTGARAGDAAFRRGATVDRIGATVEVTGTKTGATAVVIGASTGATAEVTGASD
jgi:hypothetical protein